MLTVRQLSKSYQGSTGACRAIENVDLDIAAAEFLSLLGPSGCGKTTTLRCIAGLERPDAGEIRIGGTLVTAPASGVHLAAHQRDIGMVFQSYAVWPHLDVFGNVAYPLQVRRPPLSRTEIADRVMETLELVGLPQLARRSATTLSGGQQQRVALARAIVRRPSLLLLDEPLSNLDARLREHMQHELTDLILRLGITTLAVTHDQAEAFAMADRVAVMLDGRIVQAGSPQDLYGQPRTPFIASFLGKGNVIAATVDATDEAAVGLLVLDGSAARFRLPLPPDCRAGDRLDLVIRSEDIDVLTSSPERSDNTLPGTVERVTFRGSSLEAWVRAEPLAIRATLAATAQVKAGDRVWLVVNPARTLVFRCERGSQAT